MMGAVRAKVLTVFVVVATCLVAASGLISARAPIDVFPQPEERRSVRGVLHTTLRAAIEPNIIREQSTGTAHLVTTPTFEGAIPAPTLRVRAGDWLAIDLSNDLPPNAEHARMGAFPHHPSTTNLHTHGLTVSPQELADNVFREMEPGTTNSILVNIPDDHPSGTFWYHPHQHGSLTYQMYGGMAGFLIVQGGAGTLDDVAEVKSAREVLMAFQVIRTTPDGRVPFVDATATQFGTNPNSPVPAGVWSTLKDSNTYTTTNGAINPIIHMRPGEVQRWRWLAAGSGETFVVALEGHRLNVVANDGITVPGMRTLEPGDPYVLASGQRADVLVQAGSPGVYVLQALDPSDKRGWSVVSGSGIDPRPRMARISFDIPSSPYPIALATIVVSGAALKMPLPSGSLPVPGALPSIDTMLNTPPARTRRIAFEICGDQRGGSVVPIPMEDPTQRLPSCGAYYQRYDAGYWGGTPFTTLLMMRDASDDGVANPIPNPEIPRVGYRTEGLFTVDRPLFADMISGTFEEWTIINRSFSDHSFHIHQNHFLVTHVNGQPLAAPEWHDTILVPAAEPQPAPPGLLVNINKATFGSVTFRTYFKPVTEGPFVMHCHMIQHEDLGMMQRVDLVPRNGR